jgi:hypothetical protein
MVLFELIEVLCVVCTIEREACQLCTIEREGVERKW